MYSCIYKTYYMLYNMYAYNIVYLSVYLFTSPLIVLSYLDAKIYEKKPLGGAAQGVYLFKHHVSGSPPGAYSRFHQISYGQDMCD